MQTQNITEVRLTIEEFNAALALYLAQKLGCDVQVTAVRGSEYDHDENRIVFVVNILTNAES